MVRFPNHDNINTAQDIYEQLANWKKSDEVITGYFASHPGNVVLDEVVIKVCLLNQLYNTNVLAPIMMARHIVSIEGLDRQLTNGGIDCVDRIAEFDGRRHISFASKYAHFHNKAAFPLYDKYVLKALAVITATGLSVSRYADFFKIADAFRQLSSLNEIGWDNIDHYLWLYGLKLSLEEDDKKVSHEVESYYRTSDGGLRFQGLVPMGLEVPSRGRETQTSVTGLENK